MDEKMQTAMRIADETTREFIDDLREVQKHVSFGYNLNPNRRLKKSESDELVRIIDSVSNTRSVTDD